MGNVWTELTKQAKLLGGPSSLRTHYRNAGRAQGAATVLIAGAVIGGGAALAKRLRKAEGTASPVDGADHHARTDANDSEVTDE